MQFQQALAAMLEAMSPSVTRFSIEPLAGDASSRRYFRIRSSDSPRTWMLMVMASTVPSASEEKVSGKVPHELTFLNIQRYLHRIGVAVPHLYSFDEAAGLALLEDFGDLTLEAWLEGRTEDEIHARYRQVIDLLVNLQVGGTRHLTPHCWASQEAFDFDILRWELEHYYEYGVVACHGEPPAADRQVIQETFDALASRLAALPRVFVHRDFHSRNLMIDGDRIGLIDFQDALMGPRHYDLASLLRDSYVTLPESMVDALLDHYIHAFDAAGGHADEPDPATFRANFDLMSIHRNLKAAGRFEFIHRVKGNPKFLQYIPGTLEQARRNLARYAWLEPLHAALGRSVPALRG